MSFLIALMGWLAKGVLVVLVGLSIWSVSIMIDRSRALKILKGTRAFEEAKESILKRDWEALKTWASEPATLSHGVVRAALSGKNSEQVDRAIRSFLIESRNQMESGLTVLATLGANAPFIGLFGTVLGIIQAFGVLASNPSGTAGVMASLAEALIATAVGLFVAIPAVVAYNYFGREIKRLLSESEALRDLYLSKVEWR